MSGSEVIRKLKLDKLFVPFYSGIGSVILLHRVCKENDRIFNKDLQVSPDYLEYTIKYFRKRNIDIVSLDECYSRITSGKNQKRFVTFTFDDGYLDNLTNAFPIFEKYNIPFSIFIATGFPAQSIVLWWYHLENLIMQRNHINFADNRSEFYFDISSFDQKIKAFQIIQKYLFECNNDELNEALEKLFNKKTEELLVLTKELALSWEQVLSLSKHHLVTLGAHTKNHFTLSSLPQNIVYEEIEQSIKILEKKICKPVHYFAYPYGDQLSAYHREYSIASELNLKMAFTTQRNNIFKGHAKAKYSIPRVGINERWNYTNFDLFFNGFTPFYDKFSRLFSFTK